MMDFARIILNRRVVSSVALMMVASVSVHGQSVDLIGDGLDGVRNGFFELGPFYATPVIRISTGYDSNALSTPDAQQDITALFGPGIQLGLPIGSRAFFDVYQEVDFVYYREQVDLRQVFTVTRVGGGWGGRRYLLRANDEFREETRRPTSEFDTPVETRSNRFETSLSVALGWRHKMRARYLSQKSEILSETIDAPLIPMRLNNVIDDFSLDVTRKVGAKTEAIVEGFLEKRDFEDSTRDGDSYGARAGFDFSPNLGGGLVPSSADTGITGRFLLGFRKLVPADLSRVDYTGLIGNVDVSLTSRRRHRIRGVYERDVVPSILTSNWFFVQNRAGAFFRWQFHERFSLEPGAIIGDNSYPLPRVVEGTDIVEEIVDEHTSLQLTFESRVRQSWFVGVTASYLQRTSNVVGFDTDRLLVNFNVFLRP